MPTQHIVIIGGGIIGSSSAYFLAHHANLGPDTTITVIEGSSIAAGASGKAGGLLALDWHGPSTSSLAALSYHLHASLAAEHSGPTRWDYRPLDTLSITADLSSSFSKPSPRQITTPFAWLDPAVLTGTSVLGTKASTAQVHPYKFTTSMMDLAQGKGVKVVFATVVALVRPSAAGEPFVLRAVERDGGKEVEIPATKIVIAAGPWTGRLLKELSLKAGRARGIDGSRAHSVVLRTATSRQLPAQALFTSIKALDARSTHEPEIYNRPDGTAYACGPTDKSPLPHKASDVLVDPRAIAEIVDQVAALSPEYLKVGDGEHEATIEVEQACYLPESSGDPVIGKIEEGIYVASGHTCWGITNGPGTGLCVAELLLDGKVTSAKISALGP